MFPELNSIAIRRKKLGLSQSAFAKRAGISQSMLTKVEHEKTVPNYRMAVELFNTLDELERSGEKMARDLMRKDVITLQAGDTIEKASALAKKNAVSQFIVIDHGRITGSIRTSNLIGASRQAKVSTHLDPSFPTINESTPISIIRELLKHDQAVVVIKGSDVAGIITAEDLL